MVLASIAIGAESVPTCQPLAPAVEVTVTWPRRTPAAVHRFSVRVSVSPASAAPRK